MRVARDQAVSQPIGRAISIVGRTRWIEATAGVGGTFVAHLDASMATFRAR